MNRRAAGALLAALLAVGAGARAEPAAEADPVARERAAVLAAAAELQEKLQAIDAQYRQLMERVADVEIQRRNLEMTLARVHDLENYRGGADPPAAAPPPVVGAEQKAEQQVAENQKPVLPRVSPDVGGVLTPGGQLVIEPSFEYVYSSFNRVSLEGFTIIPALLIGVIDIAEADRDTYIPWLTARYGITNRLEAELRVPWVIRKDHTRTRQFLTNSTRDQEFDADANDLGDIELGLRYQFPRPNFNWPFLTGNLRIKSVTGTDPFKLASEANEANLAVPRDLSTGSGFWSINPSVTFLYPSDPVVVFGNVGYLWNLKDDKGGKDSSGQPGQPLPFGEVDPGDALRFNFGMGFSLNDRSSFSLSYSLDLYDKTRIELASPQNIPGSDATVGKLLLGYSLRVGEGQPLNLAIGIGATDDAPDTDVTFRVPFNAFD